MKDEWIRTTRTAIQCAIAIAALVPVLVPALGISATAGVGATIVAIAAAVTRISAMPSVALLLNRYLRIPMP